MLFFCKSGTCLCIYRYRFWPTRVYPGCILCKTTQPCGYKMSFYCYIKKTNMRMQKSTEVFFSLFYYERKTLGFNICATFPSYITREKNFEVVIKNKYRYAMNSNVDISQPITLNCP